MVLRSILKDKLRKLTTQLPYLPRTLTLIWQASSTWTAAWGLLLIVQGLLPAAIVYLTRSVVNLAVPVFRTHGDPAALRDALPPVILLGLLQLASTGLGSLTRYIREAQADLIQDYISVLIHRQSIRADLAFYETPEFFDHLHRARSEATYRPVALLETLGSLLQNGITLAAMAAVLIPFGLWLPLALLVSTPPAFWVGDPLCRTAAPMAHPDDARGTPRQLLRLAVDRRRNGGRTPALQPRRVFPGLLPIAAMASAPRTPGAGTPAEPGRTGRGSRRPGHHRRRPGLGGMARHPGLLSLGDLALFYQAFQRGLQLMHSLLENAGQLYVNMLFLGNLFEFLDLSPQVVSSPTPAPLPACLSEGIRFSGVRFRYPGSDRLALDGFDLFLPAGRVAAIVGPNGAGKSTLLKLLCRFYDPADGSIRLDGIDLRDLSLDELRRYVTVLFQQPVHYNCTAAENISLGYLAGKPPESKIGLPLKPPGQTWRSKGCRQAMPICWASRSPTAPS